MSDIAVTAKQIANAPIALVFDVIVPIDLSLVFTGYGPLPAVTRVSGQSGPWDKAGRERTVHLSDNSAAKEQLLEVKAPNHFSYRVSSFTGFLRFLASEANGEWWFSTQNDKTLVVWQYCFTPKSLFTLPLLYFIARVLWHGYMHKSLNLAVETAERAYRKHDER